MKKSRIFAAVVYFIFTFGIGVVFALTLPGYFATFTVPAQVIEDALSGNDFLTGIVLAEPVGFYRKPVLDCKFEGGGGVILFETVFEEYDKETAEDPETASSSRHGMLYKALEGYVYGVEGKYDVFSKGGNATSLHVTTAEGEEKVLPLLDYDADGDGIKDGISTFTQNGFIVLELRESDLPSVKKLDFFDRTGAKVFTAEADEPLDFQSKFFDTFGNIEEYNEWVAAGLASSNEEEKAKFNAKRNEYVESVIEKLEEDPDCAVTSHSAEYEAAVKAVNKRANKKAIPFVIIYFVAIYIIADFLLGSHYIIKFFKWFLFKVCKIPHKEKKPRDEDVFGHDYFSTVTLELDLSEVPEFNGSVEIKYTRGGEEFIFTLLKENGYSSTLRMKAGVYVNPFIDIDRTYGPVDLPDNLEVEGYQMNKTIKIVKREV